MVLGFLDWFNTTTTIIWKNTKQIALLVTFSKKSLQKLCIGTLYVRTWVYTLNSKAIWMINKFKNEEKGSYTD